MPTAAAVGHAAPFLIPEEGRSRRGNAGVPRRRTQRREQQRHGRPLPRRRLAQAPTSLGRPHPRRWPPPAAPGSHKGGQG
eukprot:5607603-Pyramimonas_sp.AAC.1